MLGSLGALGGSGVSGGFGGGPGGFAGRGAGLIVPVAPDMARSGAGAMRAPGIPPGAPATAPAAAPAAVPKTAPADHDNFAPHFYAKSRATDGKDLNADRPVLRQQFRRQPHEEAEGYYFIRDFQNRRAEDPRGGARQNFTETVYWHPALVLEGGKVDVTFALNDAVTSYEVTVFGHTKDGRLAAASRTFAARKPLSLDPATPAEVTVGDRIDVPVTVTNGTAKPQDVTVKVLKHDGLEPVKQTPASRKVHVEAEDRARSVYGFRPALSQGEAILRIRGEARPFADEVSRSIRVVPEGFPVAAAQSDVLRGQGAAQHQVVLPENWVKGTLRMRLVVFPTALADLQQGLEALTRTPAVSLEQMTANTYSNALLLEHLKETKQFRPDLERRAYMMLDDAAARLSALAPSQAKASDKAKAQAQGGQGTMTNTSSGFARFDETVADEARVALGLLQLRELARFKEVDPATLERTRKFLLGRKLGKPYTPTSGRKPTSPGSPDSPGSPSSLGFPGWASEITDAYVVWALTESGKDEVTRELNVLEARARASRDPYFVALVANSLANRGRKAEAGKLLQTIAAAQKNDGRVERQEVAQAEAVGPQGPAREALRDLQIETTALAVLGWLKADPVKYKAEVARGVRWLGQQRGGRGGFGSTQSTVMALKALEAEGRLNKRVNENGELSLLVGGRRLAHLPFTAQARDPLVLDLPDAEKNLKPGSNAVRVAVTGKNLLPYTLTWSYRTLRPANAPGNLQLKLSTSLARTRATEGENVRLTVRVENVADREQGLTVAVVGLPGGLSIPEGFKQLLEHKRLRKDGGRPLLGAFEVRGRELILSWRNLGPRQKVEVPIDLSCRVPGEYRGPASRAYLHGDPEHATWVEPLAITIAPK
jgi:hypothetical protein